MDPYQQRAIAAALHSIGGNREAAAYNRSQMDEMRAQDRAKQEMVAKLLLEKAKMGQSVDTKGTLWEGQDLSGIGFTPEQEAQRAVAGKRAELEAMNAPGPMRPTMDPGYGPPGPSAGVPGPSANDMLMQELMRKAQSEFAAGAPERQYNEEMLTKKQQFEREMEGARETGMDRRANIAANAARLAMTPNQQAQNDIRNDQNRLKALDDARVAASSDPDVKAWERTIVSKMSMMGRVTKKDQKNLEADIERLKQKQQQAYQKAMEDYLTRAGYPPIQGPPQEAQVGGQ